MGKLLEQLCYVPMSESKLEPAAILPLSIPPLSA